DSDEFEFMRSLRAMPESDAVPFEFSVMPEPGPALAEPLGLVLPTPRGPAGFWFGSFVVPERIEPDDVPVLPEFIEPLEESWVPERIEPADEPVVEPDFSGAFIVVEPAVPPIGAVWPPVDGEPVVALVAPVVAPAAPVPVDCATARLLPKARATPAARPINLGYLLMIWLPVSI
ncbi:MAG TPA: hypothetical protein VFG60_02620, partial [Burkholderiaceae bacterium]|nr:hypothetical protein [Burkholderiaceae bacterium]